MPRLPAGGLATPRPLAPGRRARPVARRRPLTILAVPTQPRLQLPHARGQHRQLRRLRLDQGVQRVGTSGVQRVELGSCHTHAPVDPSSPNLYSYGEDLIELHAIDHDLTLTIVEVCHGQVTGDPQRREPGLIVACGREQAPEMVVRPQQVGIECDGLPEQGNPLNEHALDLGGTLGLGRTAD